jgi:hypothetical protein
MLNKLNAQSKVGSTNNNKPLSMSRVEKQYATISIGKPGSYRAKSLNGSHARPRVATERTDIKRAVGPNTATKTQGPRHYCTITQPTSNHGAVAFAAQ